MSCASKCVSDGVSSFIMSACSGNRDILIAPSLQHNHLLSHPPSMHVGLMGRMRDGFVLLMHESTIVAENDTVFDDPCRVIRKA